MELFGIVDFLPPLICSKEVLGQSVEIKLADYSGTLSLPLLPVWEDNDCQNSNRDFLNQNLLPPVEATTWKINNKNIFWGKLFSYPSGHSNVEKGLLKFKIDSSIKNEISQNIYDNFNNWIDAFAQFVMLLTTQNSWKRVEYLNKSGDLRIVESKENGLEHISNNSAIPITFYCSRIDTSLNLTNFKEACRLASLKHIPRLEYEILLEAYKARRNSDYRKAIIEAATALEICLTERILKEFDQQAITFGDKLINKFRMLSGRFELIRILGISFPDKDYNRLILTPRNQVTHKAFFPDTGTTNQLISEVEELLRLFSPTISREL